MFRKLLCLILTVAVLAASCVAALAEYVYYGSMMVDHCEEWVSLRDVPGTGGARLAKVPLYAVVTDAEWEPICGDFIYCCYDGQYGYILSQYLEPFEDDEPEAGLVMDAHVGNLRVMAERAVVNDNEYMLVTCEDEQGNQRWFYETMTDGMTELWLTEAFMGGAAQDPMVMVYNAQKGLTALDPFSGEVYWELTDADLGASISWASNGDGNTYIGGYYGPDPVAIDVNGHVKWRADSDGCAWLYHMELVGDTLVCAYEIMDGNADTPGRVVYDLDGNALEKRYD